MKPHIKRIPPTGDAELYLVDGKRVIVPACLMAVTRKHPLTLLGEILKQKNNR